MKHKMTLMKQKKLTLLAEVRYDLPVLTSGNLHSFIIEFG